MPLKRLFIIDDEKDFCQLLKGYFVKKNYEVEVYNLLQDGLKALENQESCTVFLDNNLPDGLGWEKIGELHEKCPGLRLHLLSGYQYAHNVFRKGAQIKVWQKPVTFN